MEKKIYNLLYNCYANSLEGNFGKLNYQLFVMSLRSMIPYENKLGCEFNTMRYKHEIETLKYYVNGQDTVVENILKGNNPCTAEDKLIQYKIIPIIISNTQWETVINQVLNCAVYFTYSKNTILNALVLSSIIFDYMNNNTINLDSIYEITKKRIIDFSIKSFYKDNFNIVVKSNYIINFEKERISYLIKNNINDMCDESILDLVNLILDGTVIKSSISQENDLLIKNFSIYLLKLRKGILDPTKLKFNVNEAIKLDRYLKNDHFKHPILGKCSVINRDGNELIMKTKTGNIKVKL
ncbi:hypothetical protein JYG23_07095 [Sedimentibacter sp. zth1]|uniref:hypothetical protein n=1 Tax=Sedimentibacter sp. zth1 TaxID=2816908 RepID=UPI001A91F460|nr:hypothetical protein [Sedimentibacter sp. zth1]QSX07102.1 hypothetical protein JYG23_07095 [Sedimentibacter sp. zth1]